MQSSSVPTYRRAWKLYSQFPQSVVGTAVVSLPLPPSDPGLFIAYMFQHQYAPSTANVYVSALGYCHRLVRPPDPSKDFWVVEMLKGYEKMGMRIDSRLPVILPILRNLIKVTPSLGSTAYNAFLFKAMPCALQQFLPFCEWEKLLTAHGLQQFFK